MENSTILIVDDNQEIREIIEILLTGEGFQAVQAKDGMTALELLKAVSYTHLDRDHKDTDNMDVFFPPCTVSKSGQKYRDHKCGKPDAVRMVENAQQIGIGKK